MPKRHRRNYVGGAVHAPLSYVDSSYKEPSASAGSTVNVSEPMLARPALNHTGGARKRSKTSTKYTKKYKTKRCTYKKNKVGGFSASVMGSFIQNAKMLMPAAAVSGYRMFKNFNTTKKNRY
jgi:hypothetical protein